MSAKFGYNIRTLANNNFLNAINNKGTFAKWAQGTSYAVGDKIYNGLNRYIANSAAIDNSTGPIHTSGIVGQWLYFDTKTNSEVFQNNFYAFFGKKTPWPEENLNIIPDPITTDSNIQTIVNDIITLKKIARTDWRLGIRRFTWTAGSYFSQYDPTKNPFNAELYGGYKYPFYCIHGNYIFKCLNNNNGARSTIAPSDPNNEPTGTDIIVTSDNYAWQYMGKIEPIDLNEFGTDLYVPINYLLTDPPGSNSTQWDVQLAAKTNGVSALKPLGATGTLDPNNFKIITFQDNIAQAIDTRSTDTYTAILRSTNNTAPGLFSTAIITNTGKNYTNGKIAMIVHRLATGSGAFVYASDSGETGKKVVLDESGSITAIGLGNSGTGYNSNTKVVIVGEFESENHIVAAAHAEINNSTTGISNIVIDTAGSGYKWARAFIIPGAEGTLYTSYGGCVTELVVSSITGHGYNLAKELGANALLCNVKSDDNAAFIYGEGNEFRQFGIITDITDDDGVLADGNYYIGPSHPEYNNIGSTLDKINKTKGEIIYLSNFGGVLRGNSTVENIAVTIVF